jgi:predicted N-acyltransferase
MSPTIRRISSLAEVKAADWDKVANPPGKPFNPFLSHAFLMALESSGSACPRTGWAGAHLLLEEDGTLAGAVPCYLKSHSQGEYVFDHGWADAFSRAGGRYYPKLQVSVPFTPATGPRLLAATADHRSLLARGLIANAEACDASSVHITFLPQEEAADLTTPWLARQDIQFHWQNRGYRSFEDFLAALSSPKRKNIRRERRQVAEAGITFKCVTGRDITEDHWDHFFAFYMETGSRKWGRPYLTRSFFSEIGETMAQHILLVLAVRGGRIIAGALNFIGGDALFGRNWGALEHHPCLHFETCYYQAIDWAIANRLPWVEAGAQGEHKLARGYEPVATHSRHHLRHPGLSRAVADYLAQERAAVSQDQAMLAAHAPFRKDATKD